MSMGISIFQALITNQSQVEHSVLAPFASPLNRALQYAPQLSLRTAHGLAMLNQMIGYQAQVIAYIDDFWLMGMMSIPVILILFFMKKPQQQGDSGHAAVMD
jgi:MFS transporter, DHA2 family, multidrug resistance protein